MGVLSALLAVIQPNGTSAIENATILGFETGLYSNIPGRARPKLPGGAYRPRWESIFYPKK
jgi:hypothetical protein